MKNHIFLLVSMLITLTGFTQVWQAVPSGTNLKLNSVSFGSELVGYIGANDSTLLKTIDGGSTWVEYPTNGIYFWNNLPDIIQVDFISADTGFAMIGHQSYNGAMYKTVDGGDNWTQESTSMCSPIFCFNFDADNSYVVGSSCFGGKTIDKKTNGVWQNNSTYLSWGNEYLRTVTFHDTLYGIAAGDSGMVHRTFDGGDTWDTIPTISSEIIWDLLFVDDSTIYAVIDSSRNSLIFSTDSGATWNEYINPLPFFDPQWKTLTGIQSNGLIAVGDASLPHTGAILWRNNQALSWSLESTPQILNDVTAINDSLAITVGDSGLIMRNGGIINSVDEVVSAIEVKVFPNPANQQFSVALENGTLLSVTVFDVLGREVVQEESRFQQISLTTVQPGLYHVVIETTVGRKVMPLLVQ
jgi:photosystem II stability/assembly factor-like uncharacterized protein